MNSYSQSLFQLTILNTYYLNALIGFQVFLSNTNSFQKDQFDIYVGS